jgi:DNA-binding NarL/FixJ family response regulator
MTINVLVADDHTVLAEALSYVLEAKSDVTVIAHVNNGRKAISKAEELRPHVVLMDVVMPELNGIDATREIRDHMDQVQVVMLSALSSPDHVLRAVRAGARGFVTKRAKFKDVVDAIHSVSHGGTYFDRSIPQPVVARAFNENVATDLLDLLSVRERHVLQLVVEGQSAVEIARCLSLSPKSVETYRSRIRPKLSLCTLPELVKFAIRHGLTTLD